MGSALIVLYYLLFRLLLLIAFILLLAYIKTVDDKEYSSCSFSQSFLISLGLPLQLVIRCEFLSFIYIESSEKILEKGNFFSSDFENPSPEWFDIGCFSTFSNRLAIISSFFTTIFPIFGPFHLQPASQLGAQNVKVFLQFQKKSTNHFFQMKCLLQLEKYCSIDENSCSVQKDLSFSRCLMWVIMISDAKQIHFFLLYNLQILFLAVFEASICLGIPYKISQPLASHQQFNPLSLFILNQSGAILNDILLSP